MAVAQPQMARGKAIMQARAVASPRHQPSAVDLAILVGTNLEDQTHNGRSAVRLELRRLEVQVRRSPLPCFQRRKECFCSNTTITR